ncbi:hypothetical protein PM738_16870 [Erysipelatoclostridium ramosum]|uniref:Uncharacterized protein n=1 Tax=Thomasclavelia ramosa TaxID=1547 RepID=A0AB35IQN4_9FIRM|nr:hypothetical protein [Thomasclavelia ramosa]MDB7085483.1 hypothetical protein [Thomasclavelia ramosa]
MIVYLLGVIKIEEGKSIGVCDTSNPYDKKYQMTMLIHARNTNITLIASDSWNHFPGEPDIKKHYIQKICFNETYPFIIAQAGENSKVKGEKLIFVKDIMQDVCNLYNGKNGQIIKNIECIFCDTIKLNMSCCSFGTYSTTFNKSHLDVNDNTFSDFSLKNYVGNKLRFYINEEFSFKYPIDEISIGGPIQWASISKDGVLSHGVEYI